MKEFLTACFDKQPCRMFTTQTWPESNLIRFQC